MFNGSKNVAPKEYDRRLESRGAFSNAFTSLDMTAYYEEGGSRALETMFDLDADRMASLSLLPEQLKSEIEVVKEERRLRIDNDINGMLNEQLYATAFLASPYHWPTIGWMKDLERIRRDEMVDYFRTYYAPNNCILVLVGDFDPQAVRGQLRRAFGVIPAQTPPEPPIDSEPEQTGERRAAVHYPSETVSFQVGYKAPNGASADYYVIQVLNRILSDGESSRLHHALVYDLQIALSANAGYQGTLNPGLFECDVEMKPGRAAAEGEQALNAVLDSLVAFGPTERELQKARNQAEASFVKSLKTNNGVGQTIAYYEHVFGDYRKMFSAIDGYRAVTADDCRRVAKQLFDPKRRTTVVLVPEAPAEEARP